MDRKEQGGIRVIIRQRPPIGDDVNDTSTKIDQDEKAVRIHNAEKGTWTNFKADGVHGPLSTQEDIWEDVRPIVEQALRGFNAVIFAYGPTNSGKTYTMEGTASQPGMIPLMVNAICNPPSHLEVAVTVSYIEDYLGDIYDLLTPDRRIRQIHKEGKEHIIKDVKEIRINEPSDLTKIYAQGRSRRKTSNGLYVPSSSHTTVILNLDIHDTLTGRRYTSRIKAMNFAGTDPTRTPRSALGMLEVDYIRTSQSSIKQVIHELNNGEAHINYRASKITRILADVLGGTSVGLFICCLGSGAGSSTANINALHFASDIRTIKSKPVRQRNKSLVEQEVLSHPQSIPGRQALEQLSTPNDNPVVGDPEAQVEKEPMRCTVPVISSLLISEAAPCLSAIPGKKVEPHIPIADVDKASADDKSNIIGSALASPRSFPAEFNLNTDDCHRAPVSGKKRKAVWDKPNSHVPTLCVPTVSSFDTENAILKEETPYCMVMKAESTASSPPHHPILFTGRQRAPNITSALNPSKPSILMPSGLVTAYALYPPTSSDGRYYGIHTHNPASAVKRRKLTAKPSV